jgi:hypothetical protein
MKRRISGARGLGEERFPTVAWASLFGFRIAACYGLSGGHMRRGGILAIAIMITGMMGSPLRAADAVASDMRDVLTLAFADARESIQKDPAGACAMVEHTRQVLGSLIMEYSTRSGDASFKRVLRAWFYRYCGYGPEKPLPGDGD